MGDISYIFCSIFFYPDLLENVGRYVLSMYTYRYTVMVISCNGLFCHHFKAELFINVLKNDSILYRRHGEIDFLS